MVEIPFSGQLQRTGNIHAKKNRCYSKLKINEEWSLVCLWSQHQPYKPECLEFRRSSTSKEVLVSGTFELMRDTFHILQRKFVQLIEVGFETTQIELEYSNENHYPANSSLTNMMHNYQAYQSVRMFGGIPHHNASNYSIVGVLTITGYTADKECNKGVQFKSLLDLSNNLESLLDPNATYFSDVNVNCGSVSFPAHKNILCARSPVFAAMFTTQMKENRDNKVNVTDLSPQVLKTMLTYIYSGKTGDLSAQSAGELLFAADKYQLDDLKRVCSDFLKSCVSTENVLRTLVLGYLHDKDLKMFAMDFICNSCEDFEALEKTVEWKTLREKRPALAMDVLTGLVKSKDRKLKGRK